MRRISVCVLFVGIALALPTTALAADPAGGAPRAAERPLVYVDEWQVAPGLKLSGRALSVALCAHLVNEPSWETQCASDVRALLRFAGESSLLGNDAAVPRQLEEKLSQVRWVLRGEIEPRAGAGWRLILRLHDKAEASVGVHVLPGIARHEVHRDLTAEETEQVLAVVPELASRLVAWTVAKPGPPAPPARLDPVARRRPGGAAAN